jgi:hypothetical protein
MISGRKTWCAILGIVVAHDLLADDGQLLSEIADEWMLAHPWLTRVGVMAVALHLINAFEANPKLDIISLGFVILRKARIWQLGEQQLGVA